MVFEEFSMSSPDVTAKYPEKRAAIDTVPSVLLD